METPKEQGHQGTWIKESKKSWLHKMCVKVLKTGPIPRHLAFIMDGNRRFAKRNSLDRAQGHLMGFDKLSQTLEWCLDLGITEVTVYAFSIENFKRSKQEVDGLMELARQKISKLMDEKDLIDKHGLCFRVIGNISLLPKDIQQTLAKAVQMTKNNTKAILNVCFAYTSREEIATGMKVIAEGVQQGYIMESDISEDLLTKCLYTNKSPDPDLLVRTSGEVRLSDFLLWQSSFSVFSFIQVLWPDYSIWHLYAGVLHYQRNYKSVQAARQDNLAEQSRLQREADYQCINEDMERQTQTQNMQRNVTSLQEKLKKVVTDRDIRIQVFLEYLENQRQQYLQDLCLT